MVDNSINNYKKVSNWAKIDLENIFYFASLQVKLGSESTITTNGTDLTEYEKAFISLYSQLFALRRSKNFGRIFTLLFIKARYPERGLDQQEIASYITNNFEQVSVSTVSRTLNKMAEQKYIDFIEEKGNYGRKRQKYFSRASFKEVAMDRLKYNIEEGTYFLAKLEKLKSSIPAEELEGNQELLEFLDQLKEIFEIITELYRTMNVRMKEKFKDLP
ncbi:MAG: helix-turn-helix domain-containing protein [Candidatus Odinarchaeota archaeon]